MDKKVVIKTPEGEEIRCGGGGVVCGGSGVVER